MHILARTSAIPLSDIMLKHSKRLANFSLGSLQEELVNEEINQEAINAKLLTNISSIDLNLVDSISVDVLICAVLVKYGLNIICAVAHIVSSLCVLPVNVCANVLKLLYYMPKHC
jgi:hypothetical protein